MMSFFITKEKSLEYALDLTFKIFNKAEIDVENITVISSEYMLGEIKNYLPNNQRSCIISKDKLHSTLAKEGLDREYKVLFQNFNGFVPIGILNIIRRDNIYVIDSSFILECNLVASNFSNSIYETDIFFNSYKLVSTFNENKADYLKIINSKLYILVDKLSQDLLLLEEGTNLENKESIKNIIKSEVESYIKLLIEAKKIVRNKNYDKKINARKRDTREINKLL